MTWFWLLWTMVQSSATDGQALQRMVASERAFAAATAEIGVRDGFLAFFAADAVRVEPGAAGMARVMPGRAALAAQALTPLPLPGRLMWEPYTGHVSSDGTLGWLTGGYVGLDQTQTQILARGAYFSVWKRQADGTWRVWLDEGVALPDVWRDASPFRVAADPDAGDAGTSGETVAAAEAAIARGGSAWLARLSAAVRIHRDGRMPVVGRPAADAESGAWPEVTFTAARTEEASSGDLAVTIGGYALANRVDGTWIRVWKRDVTGRWRIVFETSKARG